MSVAWARGDIRQNLEGSLCANVTARNGGLHPHKAVFILSRLGEKLITILG